MKSPINLLILFTILVLAACQNSKVNNKENANIETETVENVKAQEPIANPVAEDTTIKNLKEPLRSLVENINWTGQASVKIVTKKGVIYIDPYDIEKTDSADYIFITHSHDDHFTVSEIELIANANTQIIAPKECCDQLSSAGYNHLTEVVPGNTLNLAGISVEVVPAYNIDKRYHPKESNWVGYVLEVDGVTIYHPGDTDQIPEMKKIDCDLAFMPLGQTYTMDSVEEAVNAVLDVKAEVAIPFHYGNYEGRKLDAEKFKSILMGKVDVVIKQML